MWPETIFIIYLQSHEGKKISKAFSLVFPAVSDESIKEKKKMQINPKKPNKASIMVHSP